ncbi:hypothetical protein RSOLAG1IB_12161 [Rhizoctonia solani AG-1 IB]|uniref:F-box-like domain-containing protein n=1 Tax=Thanatephorus cucumeris (strain AG1-IB / isolate 7/3/14) TaxID=1108050 RepID=A0A0B7FR48_THACB|nr:hypothetical protein RSOLAG1IB_12161 [Rhizoctonia solani AG-1 IB]
MDEFTTIVSRYGGWEYLDIAWEKLENILHNIKVLELELIYPFWTSKAYHGLTELRLIGPRKLTAIITVQDLASILAASPALRIFQFGLEISRSEVSPPPTHLECLEVLILQSLGFDSQQAVLRLLLPSARLLRVAMAYNEIANQFLPALNGDETDSFLSRSNVLELHVHSRVIVDLPRLLQLLPDLRTLVLHEARISGHSTSRPVTATCTRSFLLQLHSCTIDWDALLWAISAQNIQKIMLFRTKVEKGTEAFDGENLRSALLGICPSVQISDSSSSEDAIKIEGWSEDMYGRIGYARRDNFHVL